MKHAHEITLILPEHVSLDEFQQIVNTSLETALDSYSKYLWDSEKNEEIVVDINGNECKLQVIATGGKGLIMEFEYNEDKQSKN